MASQLTVDNLASLDSEHRWVDLLDSAKRFVTQNPGPAAAHGWYYQGVAYHELRQLQQAAEAFDEAIRLDSNNSLFYNAKGLLLRDQRQYEKAIAQFELAAENPPEILNPVINKAQTLTLLQRNEEALAIYNVVLKTYPDYIPALIFKAECLKELNNPNEALATYDQAIALDPKAADLVFNKGNIYANQDRLDQALACYNNAVQLDPEFADAYYHIGLVNQRLGRREEALTNFSRAISQNSASPMARVSAAELFTQSGDHKQALTIMEEAIVQHPNSPFSHYNAAIIKLGQGDVPGSSRDFVNAIAQLDEPDTARKQLLRQVADNEHELVRVSGALSQRTAGSQRIAINYPALVEGLLLKKENHGEVSNNLRLLKTRIWDLESNAEIRKKSDAELIALQQANPALFDYTTALMRMEQQFLTNTAFETNRVHEAPTTINFLRNARELPSLEYYAWGDQGTELILTTSGSRLSKSEFMERTAAALVAQRPGYDPTETHFLVSQAILSKVHSSDQKNREIINYQANEPQQRFVQSILDKYPKLRTEVTTPATALALKDFVLLNAYLASHAHVAEFAKRRYEQNFAIVFNANLHESPDDSNFTGDASLFGSFKRPPVSRDMTIAIRFQNPNNATSESQFYVWVHLSYQGRLQHIPAQGSDQFVEVYTSSAKPLQAVVEFEFRMPGDRIRVDKMGPTFFCVTVLKKKGTGAVTKKAELWVPFPSVALKPLKIGNFKQKKRFSSKIIDVYISGFNSM